MSRNLNTSQQLFYYVLFQQLVKSLAEKENITESLKAKDMMLWVQKMNNIRNRATEFVNQELIYE